MGQTQVNNNDVKSRALKIKNKITDFPRELMEQLNFESLPGCAFYDRFQHMHIIPPMNDEDPVGANQ